MVELSDTQIDAINRLQNGCILNGGVGSGKSRTALGYYLFKVCDGEVPMNDKGQYRIMSRPRNLYIITTAKKRDDKEWEAEACNFVLDVNDSVNITVDSWNNIKKYEKVFGAFFIFDEQRVVGKGRWVKAFLNIARRNQWILLSATPGDTWSDYIPVFIANGFYKNRSEFNARHCIYSRYTKYPKIERYVGEKQLKYYRDKIIVFLEDYRKTQRHVIYVDCLFDPKEYKVIMANRWNPFEDCPIETASEWYYLQRKSVNMDISRLQRLEEIIYERERVIVFYNFDYEVERLRAFAEQLEISFSEWNGHKHEPIPPSSKWIYLVQYSAGAEGWNCTLTDTIVFFSQNYSYRTVEQASGRIDRLNTPFTDLYYYHFKSTAPIDRAIYRALKNKEKFNEDLSKWKRGKI